MAYDVTSQFFRAINLPVRQRVMELSCLIDQAIPNKDFQVLFPQLIGSIFDEVSGGWGLRTITDLNNPYDFSALRDFLDPMGPMFRYIYKLLSDPILKYTVSLRQLPLDIQQMIERGRYQQFYADLLNVDTLNFGIAGLSLNPFDYYMFHFATHLVRDVNRFSWENWNTVYFALACDYLTHFLPTEIGAAVQPNIPYYSGKASLAAPLQSSNRPIHSPSLLLLQDMPGLNSQHATPAAQTQPRNEVWRSETVIQLFIDIWMGLEGFSDNSGAGQCPLLSSSGERVRAARMLVKQVHAFAALHPFDTVHTSADLRKYARQTLCVRGYQYVRELVLSWPLDASFRLVLELWLSLVQPWRYAGTTAIQYDRFGRVDHRAMEENSNRTVDPSYMQFIAENLPSYTTIFQLIVPRFLRLDLTAPKNSIMLFRMCKVFSQEGLVRMLIEIERAATGEDIGQVRSPANSFNMTNYSTFSDPLQTGKWGALARQAVAECEGSGGGGGYCALWGERSRDAAYQLLVKAAASATLARQTLAELEDKIKAQNQGFWSYLFFWSSLMNDEEAVNLEERRKVPQYLSSAVQHLTLIFGFEDPTSLSQEYVDGVTENSSFLSSSRYPSPSAQARNKSTNIKYMGDPDLTPIASYESTILVRVLYQISSKLNAMFHQEMRDLWEKEGFVGHLTREILQKPCTIHTYTRGGPSYRNLVTEDLPPRLSLRALASYSFVFWVLVGYSLFKLLGYSGFVYIVFTIWCSAMFLCLKAGLKLLGIMSSDVVPHSTRVGDAVNIS